MREASKTGGAVGNVSDKEGDKLERTIAALDQAQGTPDFQKQLKAAQNQVKLSKTLIQNAYQEQYGHLEESQDDVRSKADAILGGK
jgi:predicted nucleotide-binding protein (sugar kinase/HSP70/actin superfamily)